MCVLHIIWKIMVFFGWRDFFAGIDFNSPNSECFCNEMSVKSVNKIFVTEFSASRASGDQHPEGLGLTSRGVGTNIQSEWGPTSRVVGTNFQRCWD